MNSKNAHPGLNGKFCFSTISISSPPSSTLIMVKRLGSTGIRSLFGCEDCEHFPCYNNNKINVIYHFFPVTKKFNGRQETQQVSAWAGHGYGQYTSLRRSWDIFIFSSNVRLSYYNILRQKHTMIIINSWINGGGGGGGGEL